MLVMSGKFDEASAGAALDDALRSGRALEQARKWIAAQGGDPAIVDDYSLLPQPRDDDRGEGAAVSGFITFIDTYQAGMFTVDLGAGRKKADDVIDYAAGVMFDRKTGDEVRAGETIARIQLGHAQRDADELTQALPVIRDVRRREAGGAAADSRAFECEERAPMS